MEPSFPLGTTRHVLQENFLESHTMYLLLTKLVRSRWLDIGLVLFLSEFMDLDSVLVHKHAKRGLGQDPVILTSHVINNPYMLVDVISSTSFIQVMLCVTTLMAVVRSCALLNTEVS